ncbi:MAG: type 1 glutamine amidotransferase [Methanomassiliicoccales archaeon]|jgi:protease I|nr:type 1 glutamine amidotransferase [Methanomassiliicoccales archaeon]MDD1756362.1 type 1 glutamine amidotransferase [Methanomassiliicoccales archaeon]
MAKTVAILAEDDYEDLELWYPYYRLLEAGHEVRIVGSGRKPVFASKHGYEVKADLSAGEVDPEGFDALVIPGGFAPDRMRRVPAVNELVRRFFKEGKVVAAICHAPSVLISANVLKGKKVTCFMSIKDDVMNAGARYKDEEVVVDGNLITSRSPADLPEFMRALLRALGD